MIYSRSPRPKAVAVATGLDGRNVVAGYIERACCPCGALLEFDTDPIGRTVERCSDGRCPNRRAHAPGTLSRHEV
jgi:hypothetical protein